MRRNKVGVCKQVAAATNVTKPKSATKITHDGEHLFKSVVSRHRSAKGRSSIRLLLNKSSFAREEWRLMALVRKRVHQSFFYSSTVRKTHDNSCDASQNHIRSVLRRKLLRHGFAGELVSSISSSKRQITHPLPHSYYDDNCQTYANTADLSDDNTFSGGAYGSRSAMFPFKPESTW